MDTSENRIRFPWLFIFVSTYRCIFVRFHYTCKTKIDKVQGRPVKKILPEIKQTEIYRYVGPEKHEL
jgi:hypothetical protein